jgi:hypothetical protein
MKYLILLCGLLATVVTSAQEQAGEPEKYFPQRLTANDLLLACASSSLTNLGRRRQQYCSGFISGVEEAVRLHAQQGSDEESKPFCFPNGMTAIRYAGVYMKYASRKTTDLNRPAVLVVIEAFADAFACDPKQP